MPAKPKRKSKSRVIEVTMTFTKVFAVEVPEGVSEMDVLDCELVDDETSPFGDADIEHDETSTTDLGHKTPEEISRMRKHHKVFSWEDAQ